MAEGADRDWLQARVNALEQRCAAFEQNQRETREELARRCKEQIDSIFQQLDLWSNNHIDYRKMRGVIERSEQIGDVRKAVQEMIATAILETFRDFDMVRVVGKNEEIDPRPMRGLARRSAEWGDLFTIMRRGLYTAAGGGIFGWIMIHIDWSWLAAIFRSPK